MPGLFVESDDVCLFVTEKCNSNCVMCPMSIDSRKRGLSISDEDWDRIIYKIPEDCSHLTITGGEPFLEYNKVIQFLGEFNQRFPNTEVLILTNGRALSIHSLFRQLKAIITEHYIFAVPIHASKAELHDRITQTKGSFSQTMKGLGMLAGTPARIEIRIVGHNLNLQDIPAVYHMLAQSGIRIDVINLLAMEMMGCAAARREELWVAYDTLCRRALPGIQYAMLHGISVALYNFPLCSVPKALWPIVKHSITPGKIRFEEACSLCSERYACGGLFFSTYELKLCQIRPFRKGSDAS